MKRSGSLLAVTVGIVFSSSAAFAQAAPDVTLTRLDCGTPQAPTDVNARFSDTYAYPGLKLQFVYSCYLIKHGDDYMMWDTGQATSAGAVAPKVGLVDLLAQLKVTPEQVKYVGISHYHGDHIGQANCVAQGDVADRQGRLGRADQPPSHRPGRQSAAGLQLDQGRRQGRSRAAGQGCVRRRQRDHVVDAGAHAGPSQPAGQAGAEGRGDPQRRRRAFPRELRRRRRADLQLRPLANAGVDRSHQEDRGEHRRPPSSSSTTRATLRNCRTFPRQQISPQPLLAVASQRRGAMASYHCFFRRRRRHLPAVHEAGLSAAQGGRHERICRARGSARLMLGGVRAAGYVKPPTHEAQEAVGRRRQLGVSNPKHRDDVAHIPGGSACDRA